MTFAEGADSQEACYGKYVYISDEVFYILLPKQMWLVLYKQNVF